MLHAVPHEIIGHHAQADARCFGVWPHSQFGSRHVEVRGLISRQAFASYPALHQRQSSVGQSVLFARTQLRVRRLALAEENLREIRGRFGQSGDRKQDGYGDDRGPKHGGSVGRWN